MLDGVAGRDRRRGDGRASDPGPAAAHRDAARRPVPRDRRALPSLSATTEVAGFDIAGAEAGFPPTRHLDAFEYLRRENAHFTIHAGEAFGLPSIWEAMQWCGADRLGHGVRIVDDIAIGAGRHGAELGRLAAYVRDKRIPLEMAPTSNVQTGAATSIAEHPIGLLTELKFRVTVNTDNRLMSGCSMTSEMTALVEAFGYDWDDLQWFTVNAMKSAFLPFDERLAIIDERDQAGLRSAARRMTLSSASLDGGQLGEGERRAEVLRRCRPGRSARPAGTRCGRSG